VKSGLVRTWLKSLVCFVAVAPGSLERTLLRAVVPDEPIKVIFRTLPYQPGFTGLFQAGIGCWRLKGTLTSVGRRLVDFPTNRGAIAVDMLACGYSSRLAQQQASRGGVDLPA
jgi:hypothetical protein